MFLTFLYIVNTQCINYFSEKQWALIHDKREGAENRVMGAKKKAGTLEANMPSGLDLGFE